MKPNVLQTLMIAKVLMVEAQELCVLDDKFSASSGLLVLQDALELVFLAYLRDRNSRGIGDRTNFPTLLTKLKEAGVDIPDRQTLEALNSERNIVKHKGMTADPETVSTYYRAGAQAIDAVLGKLANKPLNEVMLCDLLRSGPAKEFLASASEAFDREEYFECLKKVRMAIFEEIEKFYCVHPWKEAQESAPAGEWEGGRPKSPAHTRDPKWIEEHVSDPFQFIQLDPGKVRQDLLEWGASTYDFWKLSELTPAVFRYSRDGDWVVENELLHQHLKWDREHASYCLDRAILLIAKKQAHDAALKRFRPIEGRVVRVRIKEPTSKYEKASHRSKVLDQFSEGDELDVRFDVPGLDSERRYGMCWHTEYISSSRIDFRRAYVNLADCEILEPRDEA